MNLTPRCALCLPAIYLLLACGCADKPKPYGQENPLLLPGAKRLVWAVAPTVNLSGQKPVDPLLQSDLLYEQMQEIHGLTVIPVDRVVAVYIALKIDKVESSDQASLVCNLLGCDGLVVPTVTAYDPYDPPKLAASLQLFRKPQGYSRSDLVDPRQLAQSASPLPNASVPADSGMIQVVGMFDASDGSVLQRLHEFADGRSNPQSPFGDKEILVNMDRYCGFVYHELLATMLNDMSGGGGGAATTRPQAVAEGHRRGSKGM
jgi:hypothetical protein